MPLDAACSIGTIACAVKYCCYIVYNSLDEFEAAAQNGEFESHLDKVRK